MTDRQSGLPDTSGIARPNKVTVAHEEWKKKLTPEQHRILREAGTEDAWSGELLNNKADGTYTCVGCGTTLFSSASKFDSGSGWPSFSDTLKDKDVNTLSAVSTRPDTSRGQIRTEVICGKCDSHLGHVFNDGPQEDTGLRYCINSVCIKFKPEESN